MDPTDGGERVSYACPNCSSGTQRLRQVVFAHWFAGQFVIIPNFPGWVCDACGECEYDSLALEQVQLILGSDAELRRGAGRRGRTSAPAPEPDPRLAGRRRLV